MIHTHICQTLRTHVVPTRCVGAWWSVCHCVGAWWSAFLGLSHTSIYNKGPAWKEPSKNEKSHYKCHKLLVCRIVSMVIVLNVRQREFTYIIGTDILVYPIRWWRCSKKVPREGVILSLRWNWYILIWEIPRIFHYTLGGPQPKRVQLTHSLYSHTASATMFWTLVILLFGASLL